MDRGTARHDGGDEAFGSSDVPRSSIGNLNSFFINVYSVFEATVMVSRAAMVTVLVVFVVAARFAVVVVVHVLIVLAFSRRRMSFEDASKSVVVEVLVQTGANSRVVITVGGQLLGEVAGV